MLSAVVLWVCAGLYAAVDCGSAPFITPCSGSDLACLKSSAQKAVPILAAGVPELGLVPLDPMHVDRVKASQSGLNMDFRNTNVKGLRNCLVESVRRKPNKLYLDVKCTVTLVGDYTLGGQLLVLPIEGDGRYKINIRDIAVKIEFDLKTVEQGGEPHWSITNWRHTFDVKTHADFRFQNLFRGNKQLSDTIHEFANSNWRDIFQEVAPPIVKAIVAKIVEVTNKFFQAVPLNQLALD